MFPHDREVSEELLRELMGVMMHAGFGEMRPLVTRRRPALLETQTR